MHDLTNASVINSFFIKNATHFTLFEKPRFLCFRHHARLSQGEALYLRFLAALAALFVAATAYARSPNEPTHQALDLRDFKLQSGE